MNQRNSNGRTANQGARSEFSNMYSYWLQVRRDTLEELRTLAGDLHRELMEYNKAQLAFREIGLMSRTEKNSDSAVGFIASISAFLSDAASGIVSVAQACDVDAYQKKFKIIIERDSEVTKKLFVARSRCISHYQGVEEVRRNFRFSTFDSTVDDISNVLKVEKYRAAIRNERGDMSQTSSAVANIAENACQLESLKTIGDSIGTYVDANPAVLDACKSATRTVIGAVDTFDKDNIEKNALRRGVRECANELMMREDRREIVRLQSVVDQDSSQTKLETVIKGAIETLQSEMNAIVYSYYHLTNRR